MRLSAACPTDGRKGVRLNDVPPTEQTELDRRTAPTLPVNPDGEGPENIRKILKMGAPASCGIGDPSEAGAGSKPTPPADPGLAAVVNAWPTLPEGVRQAVLLLVRASGK